MVDEPTDADTLIDRRRGDADSHAALLALQAGPQASDDNAFNAWQHDSAAADYANWGATERSHARIGRWSLAAATACFSVVPPQDLAARLSGLTAPVRVTAGAEDCLVGLAPLRALASLFPRGPSRRSTRAGTIRGLSSRQPSGRSSPRSSLNSQRTSSTSARSCPVRGWRTGRFDPNVSRIIVRF